jgi:hypothetical protein
MSKKIGNNINVKGRSPVVARNDKRRRDGRQATRDKRERTAELVTAVRVAVTLWELIWALLRDHFSLGAGRGPIF